MKCKNVKTISTAEVKRNMESKPLRKRGLTPSLTRAQVMMKAFEIADRIGPEKTSVRMVAEEMHISPMGLYTYINSKDDMVNGIYQIYFLKIDTSRIPGELWEDTFRRFAKANTEAAMKHPRIAMSLAREPMWGPARLSYAQKVSSVYREQGVDALILGQSWAIYDGLLNSFISGLLNSCSFETSKIDDSGLSEWIDQMAGAYNNCPIEESWDIVIAGLRETMGSENLNWKTPEDSQ